MKKRIFSLMMLALMGCMCMTFTACGGDDDDDLPGQDVPGTATYYEPCFDWGTNADHVKAAMTMHCSTPTVRTRLLSLTLSLAEIKV